MSSEDMTRNANIELSMGHLLVVWDVLSNKLSGSPCLDLFTEEEKRAIWALEDRCEQVLVQHGFTGRFEAEWDALINEARTHVKSIPADFLE
jgi:hypothetical protein